MRRMAITDAFFLMNETRQTPMHVGGINLFTLPEGTDEQEFLQHLGEVLRYDGELRRPLGERLKLGPLGVAGPIHWERDDQLDMEYHVRHSALPKPGRYRELFALVSRLHSTLLDRNRPMWEMHLIEGLQKRQFATYMKAHHCAIDGVGAMHLTNSMLSSSPRTRIRQSPFSIEAYEAYRKRLGRTRARPRPTPDTRDLRVVADAIKEQLGTSVNVASALGRYAGVWFGRGGDLAVPWRNVPHTHFNTAVSGSRRFVAQSWPFARVRAVGKAFDGTLNDAVLAVCAGALRRHLIAEGDLPAHSLKAMAPISLRAEGDLDSANAVGFLTADLATNIADPDKRFAAIRHSMQAGKQQLAGMTPREIELYTVVTQGPMLLSTVLGLASRFPAFSTVVSNVPGPRETMYWNGARLDGIYPASIPFHGFALNITLVSYGGNLDFGIAACRRSVPRVQRLIDYMEEALVELEVTAGLRKAPRKTGATRRGRTRTATRVRP
ncbi:MAG: wax ester/triacylglycerol synthase family O-acyltransferase [Gammaproteobacteria bacterium]|nr:wax ester/triacylglycerol synthase family O-acyltransferase [Gammaproteobacteria bacterium]